MHAVLVGAPHSASLSSVIAPALYKGLHAAEAGHVQKGGCQARPDSQALQVELADMVNIP